MKQHLRGDPAVIVAVIARMQQASLLERNTVLLKGGTISRDPVTRDGDVLPGNEHDFPMAVTNEILCQLLARFKIFALNGRLLRIGRFKPHNGNVAGKQFLHRHRFIIAAQTENTVQAQRAAVIQKLSLPLLRFFGNKQDLVTALLHFRPEAIQNLCKQLMAKSEALIDI